MNAIVSRRPGPVEALKIEDIDKPALPQDGLLVRIHAASVNPADFFLLGRPGHFMRFVSNRFKARPMLLGADFSGTIEAVGKAVTQFQPGEEIFGGVRGAFAEFVAAQEKAAVVRKPAKVSFEEAAALPIAGVTALQALRDHGKIKPGQAVLINGASGGVGTYAVQLGKCFGGRVTAVCSTRNVDQARSLGADRVIDYAKEDFVLRGERYDLMVDIAGNRTWSECKQVVYPNGRIVLVGGSSHTVNGSRKSIQHLAGTRFASMRDSRKVVFFIAKVTKPDLSFLAGLLESGQMRSVIDRRFELNQVPEAMRYLAQGHARAKIVIEV